MKITEELLNEMKIKDENFSDGLIKPDGDYVRIPRGHLHGMMELLPWTENEIWKMIPDDDSPLFWLIEKTGCVLTGAMDQPGWFHGNARRFHPAI